MPELSEEPELRFPLEAVRCAGCGLVQLSVVVRPEIMFGRYAYVSSASEPTVRHFEVLADDLARRFSLAGSLVVELGSNDGVLLAPLKARGATVLGFEPASNIAALANDRGLETVVGFFDTSGAAQVAQERGRAELVLANNVLAHIDDLDEIVAALDLLLADSGVFVAEVPYLLDLVDSVEYDTIYHEHLSYFALMPLVVLFRRGGMELFDVERLAVHGGSIRIYVGRVGRRPVTAKVGQMLTDEQALADRETYTRFVREVEASRSTLLSMLISLRRQGNRIAGIGATAKGNTLLNYCAIGSDLLDFIGDSTTQKQGLLTPGMHIPVRPEEAITQDRPDATLLLAWNYAEAIIARYGAYLAAGGRFIHPIPIARLIP